MEAAHRLRRARSSASEPGGVRPGIVLGALLGKSVARAERRMPGRRDGSIRYLSTRCDSSLRDRLVSASNAVHQAYAAGGAYSFGVALADRHVGCGKTEKHVRVRHGPDNRGRVGKGFHKSTSMRAVNLEPAQA